jgi:thiol-disulfide isomerase/thioredoxin
MINMKTILVLLLGMILIASIPNAHAQGNEVCLVYFEADNCEDCILTERLLDGLINEYVYVLTAIKYNIDSPPENKNVFEAYRRAYNLPSGVPLVLFGKDDYLRGKTSIYQNTEEKILGFISQNGTNCPLESGYVPPGEVNIEILPGQPELHENIEAPSEGGEEGLEGGEEGKGWIPFPLDLRGIERMYREDPLLLTSLVIIFFLVVSLVALFVRSIRKQSENPEPLL